MKNKNKKIMDTRIELLERSRISPALPGLLGVITGLVCDWLWPWPVASGAVVIPLGILLFGSVVILTVWLTRAFERYGTSSDPSKETTEIIDTGPYRYSRNPACLAFALLVITIGLLLNNAWILLMLVPVMIAIHYIIVLREEEYLEIKFGDKYRTYKSRVRRWI